MKPEEIPTLVEEEARIQIFYPVIDKLDTGLFVETGTFVGGNLVRVAQRIKDRQKSIQLVGVDNFSFDNISGESMRQGQVSKDEDYFQKCSDNIQACSLHHIIKLIIGDGREVASFFNDESIDLIFLDAGHVYQYVKDELIAWLPKIKVGGIISGHDWPVPDIYRAVHEVLNGYSINDTNSGSYWTIKC